MCHRNQLRLRADAFAYLIKIRAAGRIGFYFRDHDAGVFQVREGTGDRIVLHLAGGHMVARLEHSLQSQIDGIRRVEGEYDPLGICDVEQLRQRAPGFDDIGGGGSGLL